MVMGHSQCGAVGAACGHEQLEGHLPSLTFALNSAYNKVKHLPGNLIENVTLANIENVTKELKQTGVHFPEMVKDGKLTIVPAYYHIGTGRVDLL
jgi:carbonic anhydrase